MESKIIIEDYSFSCIWGFLLLSFALSLVIRVILSIFRAVEFSSKTKHNHGFLYYFKKSMIGFGPDPVNADYLTPFFIGIIELLVFPFLMKSGLWVGIAFWIGLKTVAQWDYWKTNRPIFNRFLLGTGLVLIFSFTLMTELVDIRLKDFNSKGQIMIENNK